MIWMSFSTGVLYSSIGFFLPCERMSAMANPANDQGTSPSQKIARVFCIGYSNQLSAGIAVDTAMKKPAKTPMRTRGTKEEAPSCIIAARAIDPIITVATPPRSEVDIE